MIRPSRFILFRDPAQDADRSRDCLGGKECTMRSRGAHPVISDSLGRLGAEELRPRYFDR